MRGGGRRGEGREEDVKRGNGWMDGQTDRYKTHTLPFKLLIADY